MWWIVAFAIANAGGTDLLADEPPDDAFEFDVSAPTEPCPKSERRAANGQCIPKHDPRKLAALAKMKRESLRVCSVNYRTAWANPESPNSPWVLIKMLNDRDDRLANTWFVLRGDGRAYAPSEFDVSTGIVKPGVGRIVEWASARVKEDGYESLSDCRSSVSEWECQTEFGTNMRGKVAPRTAVGGRRAWDSRALGDSLARSRLSVERAESWVLLHNAELFQGSGLVEFGYAHDTVDFARTCPEDPGGVARPID